VIDIVNGHMRYHWKHLHCRLTVICIRRVCGEMGVA